MKSSDDVQIRSVASHAKVAMQGVNRAEIFPADTRSSNRTLAEHPLQQLST
jgi:hypothetical protein